MTAFDVARRLAEGIGALGNTQLYVQACAVRGFTHADLTVHAAQLRDWYGTEEGLDLSVLDADCVALHAAARSAAEALELCRAADVDAAWSGHGGGVAVEFVARHVASGARVAGSVDAAARAAERLRDDLWRIVDQKVHATIAADDRAAAQRPAWLAAARTVLGGGSEEAAAVVDSEITPHVAAVIAGEWLTAMRDSVAAVGAAYRAALETLGAQPSEHFAIPGDLISLPPARAVSAAVSAPPVTVPAAAPIVPTVPAAAAPVSIPEAAPAPNPAVAPVNPMESMATPAAAPAAPMSLPDPTAGLGELPGGFADALGGLLDPGAMPGFEEPEPIEPPDLPELDEEPDDAEEEEPLEEEEESEEEPAQESTPDDPAAEEDPVAPDEPPVAVESEAEAPETPVPEPVPLASPGPTSESATPCEMAADELPQVGE